MNFFGIGQSAEVEIVFDGADTRKLAEVKTEDGKKEKYPLYYDGETVSGRVNVTLKKPGSKLEHHGIRIELIGQIELYYDRGNHHEFQSLVRELARPGDLIQNTSYPFEFLNVEKPYEVYVGANVRLRYFLRVTIARRITDIVREVDMAVHTLCSYPEMNSPIKMEVGIEDCLHIEFEYNKSKYHLKDVTVGKIYFLLVRIKIKHMEIAIIKRETTGSGPNTFTENETIAKYEIMDGAPVKGESIPIRVFLAGYDLTPTMRDVNKKFSVRYYLNLVLMDTEDRRYFKQQEITLWRKADPDRKSAGLAAGSAASAANNPHVPSHLVGADGEIIAKQQPSTAQQQQQQQHGQMDDPLGRAGEEEDDLLGDGQQQQQQQGATVAGLMFTQENSPLQESKPIQPPPPLQAVDSLDEPLFPTVDVRMQRGAGDGAALEAAAPEVLANVIATASSPAVAAAAAATADAADVPAIAPSSASSPPKAESVPVVDPVAVADAAAAAPLASDTIAEPKPSAVQAAAPTPAVDLAALVGGDDNVDDDFERLVKPKVAQKPDTKKSKSKEGGGKRQAVALPSE